MHLEKHNHIPNNNVTVNKKNVVGNNAFSNIQSKGKVKIVIGDR